MFRYYEVAASSVDAATRVTIAKALDAVVAEIGIRRPAVRYFKEQTVEYRAWIEDECAAARARGIAIFPDQVDDDVFAREQGIRGEADRKAHEIWIGVGGSDHRLDAKSLAEVVAHEAAHLAQPARLGFKELDDQQDEAFRFGLAFAERFARADVDVKAWVDLGRQRGALMSVLGRR